VSKNLRPRIYFILGLIIGLAIGLFFGFQSRTHISELSSIVIKETQAIENIDSIISPKPKKKRRKKKNINKQKEEVIINDSLTNDSIITDTICYSDTLLLDSIQQNAIDIDSSIVNIDSININNIPDTASNNLDTLSVIHDDIIIAEDELIYSEYIIPKGNKSDFLCKTNGKLDSILTNNIATNIQDEIYVEFWISPLNSTGYRLSHNTLVLFGFYQYKSIRLEYLKNGQIKLQYLSDTFEISCSDEFVSLQLSK